MGSFLRVTQGPKRGSSIELTPGGALTVGRRLGDLLFDDPLVSGKHCRIEHRNGRWHLSDLGSTNGTLVDGRLVREAYLEPGTEITIGSNRLVLFVGFIEEPAAPAPNDERAHLAWLLDEELVELRARDRLVGDVIGQELRLPPGLHAVFEVVAGVDAGKVFRLQRGSLTIGRNTGEVPLTDAEVSRHHAVAELFGRKMIFLRDLGSTNGTFVNGRRVSVARLGHGDTLGCGKTVMRLDIGR